MSATEAVPVIRAWVTPLGFPPVLACAVVFAESSFDLDAVGDGGLAHGGIQVRTDVHGGTHEDWSGPDGLHRSLALMQGRWLVALRRQDRAGWDLAPNKEEQARWFRRFWPDAQGADPRKITREMCVEAVNQGAWAWEDFGAEGTPVAVARPTIVWKGAHPQNFREGRGGAVPEIIVPHTAAGTLAGCDSWFNTYPHIVQGIDVGPAAAHFCVGRQGEIHQYIELDDTAIANGQEAGSTAWIVRENPTLNANQYSISIEHDDLAQGALPTEAQFEASCQLAAWLWATVILPGGATNLAIDRNHIVRHSELAPVSRPFCNGWPEPLMARYVERVAAIVAGVPAEPMGPDASERLVNLRNAYTLTIESMVAESLAHKNAYDRMQAQIQGARDALARWG